MSDPDAAKYVDGIGVHWYSDKFDNGIFNNSNLQQTHDAHPDKFILYTEVNFRTKFRFIKLIFRLVLDGMVYKGLL